MQDLAETFYRARTNVVSMLIERGYQDQATGSTEELQNRYISFEEFKRLHQIGGVATDLAGIVTKEGLPVYVTFVPKEITVADIYGKDGSGIVNDIVTTSFGMERLKHTTELTDLRNAFSKVKIIIVFVASRNNKNKYLYTVEKAYTPPEFQNIELWPVHRLQVNYSKHTLIRPHKILSEIDKQAVLHRFSLNASMMPEMCIDDPLNRWFNGMPGDVYKVSRGTAPHYVIVVSRKMPISA